MQGTGKQADPYIPGNWEEFVTAVGTKNAYVSLPEGGGTFNMNKIAPTGVGIITANCEEINGNGWTIANAYNMYIKDETGSSFGTKIRNLNIKNFLIDSTSKPLIDGPLFDYVLLLDGCQISGKRISGSSTEIFGTGVRFQSCGINIAFGGTEHYLVEHGYYNKVWGFFCNVWLDYTDCTTDFYNYNDYDYAFENSFVRITTNSDKTQKSDFRNGSINNIVQIDGSNIVIDSTGESHEVTDEQLRDAAYLNSIGFPIASEG